MPLNLEKVVPKVVELARLMMPETEVAIDNSTDTSDRLFLVKFSEEYSEHMDFRDMMHQLMSVAEDYENTEEGYKSITEYLNQQG